MNKRTLAAADVIHALRGELQCAACGAWGEGVGATLASYNFGPGRVFQPLRGGAMHDMFGGPFCFECYHTKALGYAKPGHFL